MKRLAIAVTASLAIGAAGAGIGMRFEHSTFSPQARCEEDQPCWNCHTMGNLVCGPVGR